MDIIYSHKCNFCFLIGEVTFYFKIFDTSATFFFCTISDRTGRHIVKISPSKDQCNLLCYGQCTVDNVDSTNVGRVRWVLYPFINHYNFNTKKMIQWRVVGSELTYVGKAYSLTSPNHEAYLQESCANALIRTRKRYAHLLDQGAISEQPMPVRASQFFTRIFSSIMISFAKVINVYKSQDFYRSNPKFVDFMNSLNVFYHPRYVKQNYVILVDISFTNYDDNKSILPVAMASYIEIDESFVPKRHYVVMHTLLNSKHEFKSSLCFEYSACGAMMNKTFSFCRINEVKAAMCCAGEYLFDISFSILAKGGNLSKRAMVRYLRQFNVHVQRTALFYRTKMYGMPVGNLCVLIDGLMGRMTPKIAGVPEYNIRSNRRDTYNVCLSYRRKCGQLSSMSGDQNTLCVNLATSEVIMPCGLVTTLASPILHQHMCIMNIAKPFAPFQLVFLSLGLAVSLHQIAVSSTSSSFCSEQMVYKCRMCSTVYMDYVCAIICEKTHFVS